MRKIMLALSSLLFLIVLIGFLAAPGVTGNMKNSNYIFSDISESDTFEQRLEERKIPFEKLSSNSFSVQSQWKAETDMVYENMMKSAEDIPD